MALVLGIDPGTSGAFALYSTDTRSVVGEIIDTPVWYQTVGKKKRKRVDAVGITEMFDTTLLWAWTLSSWKRWAVGVRRTRRMLSLLGTAWASSTWPRSTRASSWTPCRPRRGNNTSTCPGKSKADDSAILARAEELFPDAREQFRTKRGGKRIDRAEAAMIAKFGGDFIYDKTDPARDIEYASVYRHMDTGA
jgi:hypothetical protein